MVQRLEKRQIGHLFNNINIIKRGFKNAFESDYFFIVGELCLRKESFKKENQCLL
jgi:hypothetical protein